MDEVILKTRHHHITHRIGVKALGLNGLGYNEGRLSLMPDFFEDIVTAWQGNKTRSSQRIRIR
ncbi:MAG: DUF4277 domain-containing protein [Methanoregula sp.]|nr:DUF4277 domain-containing protein [Methanoregula sp.]